MLTHSFQAGSSNLQMRRMLQKKNQNQNKPPTKNPNHNFPQKKYFFSHASTTPPTCFCILWSRLWLPEIRIAEGQRKSYSGTISAHSYTFETCPGATLLLARTHKTILFKASSGNINDDLIPHQQQ